VNTDATGRAAFTAPPDAGVLLAHLPGLPVSGSTTIILPPPNASDGVQIFDYPRLITVTDRFSVDGFGFRGDADGNRAMLGGRPALVLAASPVALVLLPGPGVPEGPAQLWIEVGGRSPGLEPVTLVSLHVTATQKQLAQGEKGKLIVRVRGTDQRLEIEARNLTAQIIQLPRGNLQRVTSTGGAFNHAEIEMLGLQPGDFSVSARLVPGVTGLPDVEAARRQLLAARPLAPKEWRERLDGLIHRMEQDPRDVLHFRDELERMLAEKLEGQFGRLIEAAWRELLKH